jgi:hypothetical protein
MAEALTGRGESRIPLFNSSLETGMRSVIVLNSIFPRCLDLARLTWLDHLVVHTADIGGPSSLHPDIPQRTGELLVRRRLVEGGLHLMWQVHLVELMETENGIQYQAREEASAFVDSLRAEYCRVLKSRAEWLADFLKSKSDEELSRMISDRIGRWSVEFQGESRTPNPV